MKVEFRQGIPNQCFEWLLENVGPGNAFITPADGRFCMLASRESDAWFYQSDGMFVSTITFKDAKMATFFLLRWA